MEDESMKERNNQSQLLSKEKLVSKDNNIRNGFKDLEI
ncbi:hypothetical protein LEP1GSC188_0561 [Leptospira weilii serovar Topaz str. LT2116]|uniref:Uncharacterized protein n=1 Tax=Leptospira weilii serovar Topaz str. LT2116 TaxID=1088540 RepID=M3G998_9LEPT|nr:hypothetical protein LEP1GSC188_0561 [Leptospira weilii serovar Topaz str. LT2116]